MREGLALEAVGLLRLLYDKSVRLYNKSPFLLMVISHFIKYKVPLIIRTPYFMYQQGKEILKSVTG